MTAHALIVASALALSTTTGCYSYHAEPAPVPAHTLVRIRFDPPRPLAMALAGRDTLHLHGVTALEGRVLSVRGDTLDVAARSVRLGRDLVPQVSSGGATVALPPGTGQVVERRRLDRGRTALAVVAAGGAGLVVLLAAALSAILDIGSY